MSTFLTLWILMSDDIACCLLINHQEIDIKSSYPKQYIWEHVDRSYHQKNQIIFKQGVIK